MKKTLLVVIAISCFTVFWTPIHAGAFQLITRDMIEKEVVTTIDLLRTVDNFIVLFDSSGSANQMVPGRTITKIKAAKDLLKERNEWLPDLDYQAGLYIYTDNKTLLGTFKEVYGVKDYDRDQFAAAIDTLPEKGQGPTMLQAALHGLRKNLAKLTGKTAVIMFTDGTFSQLRGNKSALQIAQEIVKDNDVCFYLISSATADVEKQLLDAVSKVNSCSRVIPIEAFIDYPYYLTGALFIVRAAAYVRLKPVTQVIGFTTEDLLFDFDSTTIRDEYKEKLDMLGAFLQNNPDTQAVVGGFSDGTGDDEYNMALSERRADSVKDYLMENFNINTDRIVTLWFGELNPVGDNTTFAGRRQNRRVEIAVGAAN